MTSVIKAIETRYKGYRFRSRLEARWAVALDAMGLDWEYEAEGFRFAGYSYLPDFYLPENNAYIEIKGPEANQDEHVMLQNFASSLGNKGEALDLLLLGNHRLWQSIYDDFVAFAKDHGRTESEANAEVIDYVKNAPKVFLLERLVDAAWLIQGLRSVQMSGLCFIFQRDKKTIERAIVTARTARFEHGECGGSA